MAVYTYRASDSKGRRVCGHRNVENEEAVKQYLENKGLSEYRIFASETLFSTRAYKYVSPKELSVFCKQMSVMCNSQITLAECIIMLSDQMLNKQLKTALKEIYEVMGQGYTLAEAMGMYGHVFTNYMLNMINIGQTCGTLEEVFSRLSEYYGREWRIRAKVKSAILYPAVITGLMAVVTAVFALRIIPMFYGFVESLGGELPPETKGVLSQSSFIAVSFVIFLAVIAALSVGAFMYSRTKDGRYKLDMMKIKIPVCKYLTVRMIVSRLARSLALMLKCGIALPNALDDAKSLVNNKYLDEKFAEAVKKVKDGEQLGTVLEDMAIFPPLFIKMINIGQSAGAMDNMLEKSADIFEGEAEDVTARLASSVEPLLIIILAVIMGVILVSVMLPLINIMGVIG